MKHAAKLALVGMLSISLVLYGCANVGAYINLGVTMALDVLQIIAAFKGTTVPTGDINFVQDIQQQANKDWADIQTAYTQFQATKSAGTINALTAALSVANTDLSAFEKDLHISNPALQSRISAALISMLAVVQTIAAAENISIAPPPASVKALMLKKKLSISDFKNQWNQSAASGIPSAQIQ